MNNAELFKKVFGIYAEEFWAFPEEKMLDWIAFDVPDSYVGKWIPVTERLPEADGEYLVTYEKGYAEDYGFDLIGIAPFEVDCEGFGIWQEDFDRHTLGSLGSDWVDIPVTAWMPLPKPYKYPPKDFMNPPERSEDVE